MEDQVEMLTRSRTPSRTGSQTVASGAAPAQPERNALLDSVATDEENPLSDMTGGKSKGGFERALHRVAYAAIVVVAALVMWVVGLAFFRYAVQR